MDLHKKWFQKEYTNREIELCHNMYEVELYFYQAIRNGDIDFIETVSSQEHFEELPGLGTLSDDYFRNIQYHFVASVTLATRACVEGGLPIEIAFSLSDFYIQQLDSCKDIASIDYLTYQMNLDFTKRMHALHNNRKYSKPINKCMDYIYTHLHHRIRVDDLSNYVNLNKSHLSKIFKKETGYTIQEYILREKIREAKSLLIYSPLTCNQIAHDLSFASQSHFISVFKKMEGITPNQYRNQHL